MERRRPRLDPVVAAQVNERLALVLTGPAPRRAEAPDPALDAEPVVPSQPAERSEPAESAASTESAESDVLELGVIEDLPPARRFGRTHLGVVAVLVVLAMVVAGWTILRARPVAVANPGEVVTASAGPPASSAGPASASAAPPIVVHVLGAVRDPGLVSLPADSRVQDAIKAAGGLKADADPGELNLAQLLSDGQQVVIGSKKDPVGEVRDGGAGGGSTGGGGAPGTPLDLNRATQAQLEELPGVGPVTAGKIVSWRTEHTRFSRVEELQEVDGIGPKTYAQIAPHVRV